MIYRPRKTEDLRPELLSLVGQEVTPRGTAWLIEEEDGGPYVGETAIYVKETEYWIPSGDLQG